MQNKGFVRLLAAALMLVCLFYLSFSFVTNSYSRKADEYAKGDNEKYYNFMDSVAGEKVWLGYTLRECREKEINLGLDLKGGMNVTLEVSVSDILRALSDYNNSEIFNNAIEAARVRQARSGENFLNLFVEEFHKIDPNAKLSTVFSTYDLKDQIQPSTSDAEVVRILQEQINSAIDNSFNVLRNRIDRFGVVQPNIQKLDVEGRILVELPGIKEPERVRKLLQGSANLEFWETYKYQELISYLDQANAIIREMNKAAEAASADTTVAAETEVVEEVAVMEGSDSTAADSLSAIAESLSSQETAQTDAQSQEEMLKEYPLFAKLQPMQNNGPIVGVALGSDTAAVNKMLSMKQVKDILPRDLRLKWTVKPIDQNAKQLAYELIAIKVTDRDGRAPLEGDVITDARSDFDQLSGGSVVSMKMSSEGSKVWARLTKENIGREIAIVLDNYVYSFPTVNSEITGGSSQISGQFTPEEAKDLANVLNSGKMPAPAHIVQEDVVGPSLGQTAINNGFVSFVIAFVLVLAYMIVYYGVIPGLIADGALVLNILFIFGILASFKAVLTMPGIAGIVLTLGMAVDANVLIYERIREELRGGKNFKKAVADGYSNAFSAIADSNITTLLTGVILVYFGTGPIKGFATTLIIGIISSVFTAVFLTRLVYDRMNKHDKCQNLKFITPITKNFLQNNKINFVKIRRYGYIVACVFALTAIVSLSFRGLKQGIDFSGGRNYVVRFEQPVKIDDMRETLSGVFDGAQLSVITMGSENQVRISTNYGITSIEDNVDAKITNMLYNGVKPWLNSNVTESMFVDRYVVEDGKYLPLTNDDGRVTFGIQSSQKVGPTVADDIKVSAVWSVLLAIVMIGLYILVRFRNWAFSAGAIAALVHDVLFILGVYSIFYSIMPFSLEIDQSFIAAILTVVGYSINDKVVVFDRIRENLHLYPKRDLEPQINDSLNSTLSRTFSTSMSTAIVLIAIFIFGGETIRGFVFAMLLGVIVGTCSTWFVATPIAYDLQKKQRERKAAKAA